MVDLIRDPLKSTTLKCETITTLSLTPSGEKLPKDGTEAICEDAHEYAKKIGESLKMVVAFLVEHHDTPRVVVDVGYSAAYTGSLLVTLLSH